MKEKDKTLFAFVFICILVLFCAHVYFYKGTIIDEAFISFRYARNWAEGWGPVFNHGERVEGYTNFLMVLLLTLGFQLTPQFNPLLCVKLIGIVCAVMQLVLCAALAKKLYKHSATLVFLPPLLLACDGTFIFGTVNGLETQMFALFVMLALVSDINEGDKISWRSTLFYFLALLSRPDGAVFFILSRGLKFLSNMRASKKLPSGSVITSVIFVVATGIYMFSKYLYYGSFFPNTFYAKTGYNMSGRLLQGFYYLLFYIRAHPVSFLVFVLLSPIYFRAAETKFLAGIFCGFTVYLIYVGGDWLQGSRFFVPLLPVFYVLLFYGLQSFLPTGTTQKKQIPSGIMAFIVFWTVLALAGQLFATCATYHYAIIEKTNGYKRAHFPLARLLKKHFTNNATIALMDVGIIGYITDMRVVDIMGLTDEYISHHARGENLLRRTYPVEYIFNKNPDNIVLANSKKDGDLKGHFLVPMEEKIYAYPEFQKQYDHLAVYFHRRNYYLHAFMNKGLEIRGVRERLPIVVK